MNLVPLDDKQDYNKPRLAKNTTYLCRYIVHTLTDFEILNNSLFTIITDECTKN